MYVCIYMHICIPVRYIHSRGGSQPPSTFTTIIELLVKTSFFFYATHLKAYCVTGVFSVFPFLVLR